MSIVTGKISQPYAAALFALAKSENSLNEITIDVNNISSILSASNILRNLICNPLVNKGEKKAVLKNIFQGQRLSSKITNHTLTFLFLLIDRGRIAILDEIIKSFTKLLYSDASIEVAEVTSIFPLRHQQLKDLADKLKIITGAKKILVICKSDQTLLGGFTIKVGSKFIDASVKGQLKNVNNLLSRDCFFVNSIL